MSREAGASTMAARQPDATEELLRLMRRQIAATGLDLRGMTVLTEAATGAYAATPVIAALAGAVRVRAFTRSSRHGSVAEVRAGTLALAEAAGVSGRISVIEELSPQILGMTDIVTNSGHLRPLDAALIEHLPQRAVIGLMFEGWEFRTDDIDRAACLRRGIPIVGVNERHPAVGVFAFLGPLCVRLLHDAGLSAAGRRIAVLCDNPFAPFLADGLTAAGASAEIFDSADAVPSGPWDVVVVSLRPEDDRLRLADREIEHLAHVAPGALLAQFWGDIDRDAARRHGFSICPPNAPHPGHMAILLGALGPEPIIRLQTGGLRAAEIIHRGLPIGPGGIAEPL